MANWLWLLLAIALEVAGTTAMKMSLGFTRWVPSLLMFAFYLGSLGCMNLSLRSIDIGVAYAVWSGVGTAMIVTVGWLAFGESLGLLKLLCLLLIIVGVVGLNLWGDHHEAPAPHPRLETHR